MSEHQSGKQADRQSILIVEDHDRVRRALVEWLADAFPRYRILEASTGEEAVGLAEAERPDIIVMDVGLPQMSGIEATRRIKAVIPKTRVVILTIHEQAEYRARASEAGANAFVPKRTMYARLLDDLKALTTAQGPGEPPARG